MYQTKTPQSQSQFQQPLSFLKKSPQPLQQQKHLKHYKKNQYILKTLSNKSQQNNKYILDSQNIIKLPFFQIQQKLQPQHHFINFTNSLNLSIKQKKYYADRQFKGNKLSPKKQKKNKFKPFSRNLNPENVSNLITKPTLQTVLSQIKFPKLINHHPRNQVPSSNSLQIFRSNHLQHPQHPQPSQNPLNFSRKCTISLQTKNQFPQNKINNLKLDQIFINAPYKKSNHLKSNKSFQQYQNLITQLKSKVSQLTPTFKKILPLQTLNPQQLPSKKQSPQPTSKKQSPPLNPKKQLNQFHSKKQLNQFHPKKSPTQPTKKKQSNQFYSFLQNNLIYQIGKRVIYSSTTRVFNTQDQINKQQTIQQHSSQRTTHHHDKINKTQQSKPSPPKSPQSQISNSLIPPKKPKKKLLKITHQNFHTQQLTVYHSKMTSYRQFLFLINFTHRIFDPIIIQDNLDMHKKLQNKYKFYLGRGNNSLLIKSLLNRRFWWIQVQDPKQANFVWTQLKINEYYTLQPKSTIPIKYDKLQPHLQPSQKKPKKKPFQYLSPSTKKPQQQLPPKFPTILRGLLPQGQKKLFTQIDSKYFKQMINKINKQQHHGQYLSKFQNRLKYLPNHFLKVRTNNLHDVHLHNHFISNFQIGNKKALFYNLKHYYQLMGINPFNTIPLTFHIKKGINDPQYSKFLKQYRKIKFQLQRSQKLSDTPRLRSRNVWIIKPGQLSNRGNGITVFDDLSELTKILKSKQKHTNGIQKTYIIQKYIQRPLLYKNRKFDIRHYMMLSRLHGRMRGYWFSQGYIRTSSQQYDIQQVGDEIIHLTNDAIQKYGESYGKYQQGNKLSYAQFQKYLDLAYPQKKYSFLNSIYPRMKSIATDSIKATYLWIDPNQLQHNFQIFGLDFMIDYNFNVWLIQVNTNPCLQLSSTLLSRIIPTMVQNTLRITIDPIFPPTAHYLNTNKYLAPESPLDRMQYQIIFDQSRDGKIIQQLFLQFGKANCGDIQEDQEIYQNDGKQIDIKEDIQ